MIIEVHLYTKNKFIRWHDSKKNMEEKKSSISEHHHDIIGWLNKDKGQHLDPIHKSYLLFHHLKKKGFWTLI